MPSEIELVIEDRSPSSNHPNRAFTVSQCILRVLAIVSAALALGILLTSKQEVLVFGIPLKAQYNYSPAFKFLAAADGVVCGFSVLGLMMIYGLGGPQNSRGYFFLFLMDLVTAMLMISACSAAVREGYIAKYGSSHMGWMPICNRVPKFCNKVTISTIFSIVSAVIYFILTIISGIALMPASSKRNSRVGE